MKARPPKSKLFKNYQFKSGDVLPLSNYKTTVVYKINKPHKEYIFKNNPQAESDLEAFNGICYDLLLGKQHPKIRTVYDDAGNRLGILSHRIKNFKSLEDQFYAPNSIFITYPTLEEIIRSKTVRIWAAALLEEENDLHEGNYGSGEGFVGDKSGETQKKISGNVPTENLCSLLYKVDDNQATWSITSKYAKPSNFKIPISREDITNFPTLTIANPFNWPTGSLVFNKGNLIYKLKKEQAFIDDKYDMFLKRALIPAEIYEAIGQATIRSENLRAKAIKNKQTRTEELKKELLAIPEFQHYFQTHPDILADLKKEFQEYNQKFPKPEDAALRIDLAKIEENYNKIKQTIAFASTAGISTPNLFYSPDSDHLEQPRKKPKYTP